ncbi:hypothetical protein CSC76_03075 [Pseudoxanthomonas mexicana]|uniref:hypothetical protein n=1 Tax=Pseudoxanthomonas mexicana TaxID=128785 RepID=UPI00138A440A|nr:hypothetical protein [Pseudoxanthomonas mexicana]KAF1728793.1 hypothetical protein CSC76_03075 [Pseudoxanthomonas mexicana]
MKYVAPLTLAGALASVLAAPFAHAADNDDRFTLRLGAMDADTPSEFYASTVFQGEDLQFSQDFDLGSEVVPRVDGVFRFSDRNRLIFDYFKYDKDREVTLGEDLSYDDVTIPAGGFARAEANFELASLLYDFSIMQSDAVSVGLQIGAQWAKLEGGLRAEAGENVYDGRASEDGFAPVVGARVTFTPGEKWLVNLQAQYMDAGWGDFGDYDGDISRANAVVEYRFTRNFGLFAGYDWFKLDVSTAGSDSVLGLDQRFKGPVAGVTLAF